MGTVLEGAVPARVVEHSNGDECVLGVFEPDEPRMVACGHPDGLELNVFERGTPNMVQRDRGVTREFNMLDQDM